MKKLKSLKFWVQSFNQAQQAVQDSEVLLEFFKEAEVTAEEIHVQLTSTESLIENLEFRNLKLKNLEFENSDFENGKFGI